MRCPQCSSHMDSHYDPVWQVYYFVCPDCGYEVRPF